METFGLHQLAQISRIPKQIRNMSTREFGEKYQGNLQAALRGYQKERLAAAGIDTSTDEIDRSERKRKWVASHEVDPDVSGNKEPDPERSLKTGLSLIICRFDDPRLSAQLEHNCFRPRSRPMALRNDHIYLLPRKLQA